MLATVLVACLAGQGFLFAQSNETSKQKSHSRAWISALSDTAILYVSPHSRSKSGNIFFAGDGNPPVGHGEHGFGDIILRDTCKTCGHFHFSRQMSVSESLHALSCQFTI